MKKLGTIIGWIILVVGSLFCLYASASPVISNVYVQSSTATTATIVWTTSTPATSLIRYGNTNTLPYSNNTNYSLVTAHSMTLTLLSAVQPYYFAVVSVDGSGNSTLSSTYEFSLCGTAYVPVSGTINQFYYSGTFAMSWNPPSGAVGTPTVCGLPVSTTVTGSLNLTGSFSTQVADALKITPGPGTWTVSVQDIGDLSPVSVTLPLSATSPDISSQLQTAAAGTSLVGVIANNNAETVYPPWLHGGGSVTFPTGVLYGNNSTAAPTVATGTQIVTAIGSTPVTNANNVNSGASTTNANYFIAAFPNASGFQEPVTVSGFTINPSTGGLLAASLNGGLFSYSGASTGNTNSGGALTAVTGGVFNSATGDQAMQDCTTCIDSDAFGSGALDSITTGGFDSGFGGEALYSLVDGNYNTACGFSALYYDVHGSDNTACGYQALEYDTAAGNTALGWETLQYITIGTSDVGVGRQAGQVVTGGMSNNTTGSGGTFIGDFTTASADGDTNETVIGYLAGGAGSNSVTIGNTSVTKTVLQGIQLPGYFFSAGGTPLPACASAYVGGIAAVSDATSLVPGTAYSVTAGAGTDRVRVQCTYTGSTYAWQTM